jgi:hypothetical protein
LTFPISGLGLLEASEEEVSVVILCQMGLEGRNEENPEDNKGEDPLKSDDFDLELLKCN